jgi:hypothetical protein
LPEETAARIVDAVARLDDLGSVRDLSSLLRLPERARKPLSRTFSA